MVSTQIMNGLANRYELHLVCLGEKPQSSPYQIDDKIQIHYLNIKKNISSSR